MCASTWSGRLHARSRILVWSNKEGGIGADIPRELTSTLPLAPLPPLPSRSSPPSLVQHGWELLSLPLSYGLLFPRSGIPPAGSVIALSTAAFFADTLLLSSGKGNGTSPFSYSRPRSRSATTRGFYRTYEFRGLFRAIYATHAPYANAGTFLEPFSRNGDAHTNNMGPDKVNIIVYIHKS